MISLALVSVGLAVEAIRRFIDPPEKSVDGALMSGIAFIGVCVNIVLAIDKGKAEMSPLMPSLNHEDHNHGHAHGHTHSETDKLIDNQKSPHMTKFEALHVGEQEIEPSNVDKRNVNLWAAYLHVMADLLQSVAVLGVGLVIWYRPEWHIIDPILTLGFCIVVFFSTLGVLRSAISVLLEETPPAVSWQKVYDAISLVPNVTNVHDLHIWSISHGQPGLSVHCFSGRVPLMSKLTLQIGHAGFANF